MPREVDTRPPFRDFKVSLTDKAGIELSDAMTVTARERPEIIVFGDLVFKLAQVGEPSVYALVPNAVVLS